MAACPCGSRAAYADCCRPYLRGTHHARTAEALMRSRYTAYVRRDEPYLLRTWDPKTRPSSLDLGGMVWLGLEILDTTAGAATDAAGTVTFVAHHCADNGVIGELRETSRFVREGDTWQYVDGIRE